MAPLLASRVFFSHTDPTDLSKVQWTYLGIAAFVFLLAVVFFFSPLPEVTDADMALQAEQCSGLTGYVDKPMRKQYKLMFGVAAQFCYVGAQVCFLPISTQPNYMLTLIRLVLLQISSDTPKNQHTFPKPPVQTDMLLAKVFSPSVVLQQLVL